MSCVASAARLLDALTQIQLNQRAIIAIQTKYNCTLGFGAHAARSADVLYVGNILARIQISGRHSRRAPPTNEDLILCSG